MIAVSANDMDAVVICIEAGHDVNAVDSEGDPALVYSVRNHYETITRRLLDAGADLTSIGKLVNAHTPDGALSAACTFYSPSCLTRALSICVSAEGVTRAYDIAVSKGYMDFAYLLHIKRDVLMRRFRIV